MTEGEQHFLAVVPASGLGGALGRIRLEGGIHHGVVVTGFVILVANVDALGFHDVSAAVIGDGAAKGACLGIGDFHAGVTGILGAVGGDDLVIRIVAAAEVHQGGDGGVVRHIGVRQRAGGIGSAGEDVGDADALIVVDHADVGDAVHLMVASGHDVLEYHGVAGVHQDNDLGAGLPGQIDHRQLLVAERQRILAGGVAQAVQSGTGLVGVAFAGAPGKDADTNGAVLFNQLAPIGGDFKLLEAVGSYFHDLVVRHIAGGIDEDVVVNRGGNLFAGPAVGNHLNVLVEEFVHVDGRDFLIDLHTGILQRLQKIHGILVVALEVAACIDEGCIGSQAKENHRVLLVQRQRAVVVLHHNGALFAFPDGNCLGGSCHFFDCAVVTLEADAVLIVEGHIALRSQETIQRVAVGVCQARSDGGKNQDAGSQCRNAAHECRELLGLHVFSSCFSFL